MRRRDLVAACAANEAALDYGSAAATVMAQVACTES